MPLSVSSCNFLNDMSRGLEPAERAVRGQLWGLRGLGSKPNLALSSSGSLEELLASAPHPGNGNIKA